MHRTRLAIRPGREQVMPLFSRRSTPLPYELQALRSHNRLHVRAWGHPTPEEAFACANAAIAALSKLRAGFDVLADVSGLNSLSDACMPHVERLQSSFVENQVRRVVRVCGPLPEIILKLERHARSQGYAAHLATSVEEAESLLDAR